MPAALTKVASEVSGFHDKGHSIANKIDKFRCKRILRKNHENQEPTFRLQHMVKDVNLDEELLDSPYEGEPQKSKMLTDLLIMASHDSCKD